MPRQAPNTAAEIDNALQGAYVCFPALDRDAVAEEPAAYLEVLREVPTPMALANALRSLPDCAGFHARIEGHLALASISWAIEARDVLDAWGVASTADLIEGMLCEHRWIDDLAWLVELGAVAGVMAEVAVDQPGRAAYWSSLPLYRRFIDALAESAPDAVVQLIDALRHGGARRRVAEVLPQGTLMP